MVTEVKGLVSGKETDLRRAILVILFRSIGGPLASLDEDSHQIDIRNGQPKTKWRDRRGDDPTRKSGSNGDRPALSVKTNDKGQIFSHLQADPDALRAAVCRLRSFPGWMLVVGQSGTQSQPRRSGNTPAKLADVAKAGRPRTPINDTPRESRAGFMRVHDYGSTHKIRINIGFAAESDQTADIA
jgi:hypothetical protein